MNSSLTRRQSLIAGAGLLLAGTACAGFKPQYVDTHIHLYDPTRPEGVPWPAKDDELLYKPTLAIDYLKAIAGTPMTGAIVVECSPRVEDNQWCLDQIKVNEDFFDGVVGRLLPDDKDFERHLERFAKTNFFRGIRWSSDEVRTALKTEDHLKRLKALADASCVLEVNGSPEVLTLAAQLAEKLPDLRIIVNHLGNVAIDGKDPPETWVQGMKAAAVHANIWCKLSGLVDSTGKREGKAPTDLAFYRKVLDVAWDTFGRTKLLYGSNWPVSNHFAKFATTFDIVRAFLDTKDIDAGFKVFADNPAFLYQLHRR
jgi:predicted TIM-barrel fold metal-dependent hydrolase